MEQRSDRKKHTTISKTFVIENVTECFNSRSFVLLLLVLCFAVHFTESSDGAQPAKLTSHSRSTSVSHNRTREAEYYVDSIFRLFDNEDGIAVEHFNLLLRGIGLAKMTKYVNITVHHDHENHNHDHHTFQTDHYHDDHDHGVDDPSSNPGSGGHVHSFQKRQVSSEDPEHGYNKTQKELEYQCLTSVQLLHNYGLEGKDLLDSKDFLFLCPALIYQLHTGVCKEDSYIHSHDEHSAHPNRGLVWLYTMVAVFVISLCALVSILCVPRKNSTHTNPVLQFLIALAMGSLSGDAMLHLIPHAMASHDNLDAMFKGLFTLLGTYAFYFMERIFSIVKERRNHKRRSALGTPMIDSRQRDQGNNSAFLEDSHDSHGHSHEGMMSCTPSALMIIVGDMFHNFCDGLAIGAAFSASMSVGISTSVAVFCHELPHEIGDFAVLIASGMSIPRAIAFNLLSTVPCFFGAAIGLELGTLGDTALWIFALVGGMFVYISLVVLVPELSKGFQDFSKPWVPVLVLQTFGIALGVTLMVVLGIYETDLENLIS